MKTRGDLECVKRARDKHRNKQDFVQLAFYKNDDIKQALTDLATDNDCTIGNYCRQIVINHLYEQGKIDKNMVDRYMAIKPVPKKEKE